MRVGIKVGIGEGVGVLQTGRGVDGESVGTTGGASVGTAGWGSVRRSIGVSLGGAPPSRHSAAPAVGRRDRAAQHPGQPHAQDDFPHVGPLSA